MFNGYDEDKTKICAHLLEALKETRESIEDLIYVADIKGRPDLELVTIAYRGGYTKTVNVSLDSGLAMMRDILKSI